MQNNTDQFLDVALKAAHAAEDIVLTYFGKDIDVTLKSDQSPVTIADKEAEKVIVDTIRATFPDHGFLGEETGTTASQAEYTWIIDPIDGTRNFIRGVPLFGTLIALMKDNEVILGVSNMPVLRELIHAEKGKGAYKDGVRLSVSSKKTLGEAYLSYGGISQFIKQDMLPQLLSIVGETGRNRDFGDCWQYHLLAEGKIDIVVDHKVKIWDVAPAKIIVEEAGGTFTDKDGNSLGKGTFVAVATNGLLHAQTLGKFST